MSLVRISVNLDSPPTERWSALTLHQSAIHELLSVYVEDIGGIEQFGGELDGFVEAFVRDEHVVEMASIARLTGLSATEVALGNLYYDALKFALGCTAFSVDTVDGPVHARNLDWWSPGGCLAKHSMLIDYVSGGELRCTTVGWPGFCGALSGIAPGRFAVTLNAVLSDEPMGFAQAMTFLIRDVLIEEPNFESAVERLAKTRVASDSLLMVTGPNSGQMVVIERTPSTAHFRHPVAGRLVLTNDYRARHTSTPSAAPGVLAASACARFDRARHLSGELVGPTNEQCLAVLEDAGVKMSLTVQQMVFRARTGEVYARAGAEL